MLGDNRFNLYLIRHGQSLANTDPHALGQDPESPLTDRGKRQAQLLQARFHKDFVHFDHICASPYLRALDTARIVVGPTEDIVVCPEIREYSAGDWVGSDRRQVINKDVSLKMSLLHNAFLPPNGESMHQVERRASRWLEDEILYNPEIMAEAQQRQEQQLPPMNIAVFSHGMTIKCLLHYVMGFDRNFTWRLTIDNTSVSQLVFNQEGWRLISINDRAHLL